MTAAEIRRMQSLMFGGPPTNEEQAQEWKDAGLGMANFIALERCALAAEHNELMVEWMKTAQPVPEEVVQVRARLDQIFDDLACAEAGEETLKSLTSAVKNLAETVAIIAGERRG